MKCVVGGSWVGRGWVAGGSRKGRGSRSCLDAAAQENKKDEKQRENTPAGATPPAVTRPGNFMTPFGYPLTLILKYNINYLNINMNM